MAWTLWASIGAGLSALTVVLGAFAAHLLKARLDVQHYEWWEIGVRYQMYHSLALLILGLVATRIENTFIHLSGICLLLGILLFCGSLYGLALSAPRWLGAVAPIGGGAFILGWLLLVVAITRGI